MKGFSDEDRIKHQLSVCAVYGATAKVFEKFQGRCVDVVCWQASRQRLTDVEFIDLFLTLGNGRGVRINPEEWVNRLLRLYHKGNRCELRDNANNLGILMAFQPQTPCVTATDEERWEEIVRLRALPMREYYQTEHWQNVRQQMHLLHGRCQKCAYIQSANMHIHHRHYNTVGMEQREDLLLLCDICHALYHGRQPSAESLQARREYEQGMEQEHVRVAAKQPHAPVRLQTPPALEDLDDFEQQTEDERRREDEEYRQAEQHEKEIKDL